MTLLSDAFTHPESRHVLLENLRADQTTAIRERTAALDAIASHCPPALSVNAVREANHHLDVVLDRLQNAITHYTHSLRNDEVIES